MQPQELKSIISGKASVHFLWEPPHNSSAKNYSFLNGNSCTRAEMLYICSFQKEKNVPVFCPVQWCNWFIWKYSVPNHMQMYFWIHVCALLNLFISNINDHTSGSSAWYLPPLTSVRVLCNNSFVTPVLSEVD